MIRASYVGALARIFRYLSDSITILPDAQGQNDAHGKCAAELPGICDVNLVSHTMGDATWPSTWSRGFCKRENPTQGAPVRTVPHGGGEIRPHRHARRAKRTGVLMADASIAWTSRHSNRFLNGCLRLLTPAPFTPHARPFTEPQ